MDRVVVVGSSGSGKTTVSRRLAAVLGIPHLELDGLYHQPGWTPINDSDFVKVISEFVVQDRWVVDGNYVSHGSAELVWPRVDTVVWLDFSRSLVMRQVIGRTLRRAATREKLWNDNTEPWTNLYSLDPEKNIIVWAWTRYAKHKARYETCLTNGTWSHASVQRLRSRSEVEDFLTVAAETSAAQGR